MSTADTKDTRNIVERLIAAQRAMKPALKDATNTHFKNSYTTLGSAWDACKEALWAEGMTITQRVASNDGVAELVTVLMATNNETIVSNYPLLPARANDPQAFASCVTYARRYSLMAMVGLVPEDDDGNEASAPAPAPTSKVTAAVSADQLEALRTLAKAKGDGWKHFLSEATGKTSALELSSEEAGKVLALAQVRK